MTTLPVTLTNGTLEDADEVMANFNALASAITAVTSGGSANTQTVNYTVGPTSYATGDCYTFIAGHTNTGSMTLNVNSLGPKTVKNGTANLAASQVVTGTVVIVCYDGAAFQIVNPAIGALLTLLVNLTVSRAMGAAPAGTTIGLEYDTTFSGDAGGTTDVRGIIKKMVVSGTNSVVSAIHSSTRVEVQTTAGLLGEVYAQQDYVRLGLASTITGGAITNAYVYNAHLANEGDANADNFFGFTTASVDLVDGSGLVGSAYGFYAGNQGHATRVTNRAIGYASTDMTAGAAVTAAFYSEMDAGTNKWGIYFPGTAVNAITGKLRIGSTTAPTNALDVTGSGTVSGSWRTGVVTFAGRPGTPAAGDMINFSDSNTATWGATIAGGGANNVLARYNGTNWTVVGA